MPSQQLGAATDSTLRPRVEFDFDVRGADEPHDAGTD
jgi:hypothetical protein